MFIVFRVRTYAKFRFGALNAIASLYSFGDIVDAQALQQFRFFGGPIETIFFG